MLLQTEFHQMLLVLQMLLRQPYHQLPRLPRLLGLRLLLLLDLRRLRRLLLRFALVQEPNLVNSAMVIRCMELMQMVLAVLQTP